MNPDPHSLEELEILTSRLLDGELSSSELDRLASLLESNPAGHAHFVQLCELHGMLEAEPAAEAVLSEDYLPKNVVSLPGGKAFSSSVSPDGESSARKTSPFLPTTLKVAAVAAVAAGIFFLLSSPEVEPAPELELVTTEEGPITSESEEAIEPAPIVDTKPEDQYERAVLAALGSGSQQRPPTNFTSEPSLAGEKVSYNRDIRPILSDNCFSCHGPDEASREAKLRLDTRDGATGGETVVVVAGSPSESELIARILTTDVDDMMPPPDSHKKLSAAQIELLTRWVTEGAEYEDHWAFLPITNAAPEERTESPIDFFVDRRLEKLGMTRSAQADERTLVRRVTLDLTGLPPTPGEIEAFVADKSENAYEKLIDRLLARPSFGEHRARYWLDAARYGDTHGLHLDNYREMWPYRDWVVSAFNQNMPFDQFTIEQIAGDLLPNPTQDQMIATGFNRCNVTTSEGGAIEEEFLVRYAVDRVSTTSTVWMGLTAGCSQCHDHKFDPITMKDFYSLFAFFNNTTQPGMDGNAKDSPPVIRVYASPDEEKKSKELQAKIAAKRKELSGLLKKASLEGVTVESVKPDTLDHGDASAPTNLGKIANFGKSNPFTVAFRFRLPDEDGHTVLAQRVDPKNDNRGWRVYWEDRGLVVELIEQFPGKVLKRGITRRFKPGGAGHFAFSYDGSGSSNGIRMYSNGGLQASRFTNQWYDSLTGNFASPEANLLVGGKDSKSGLTPTITEFVITDRSLTDTEIKTLSDYSAVRGIEKKPAEKRSDKEKATLQEFLAANSAGPQRDLLIQLSQLESELGKIESKTPTTLVMAEKEEAPKAFMLERGEYEQKGEEVTPAFPAFLPGIGSDLPMNRLGLAQWLVHPDHPLTARVTVNRIWQEMFGVGLVKTSEDFGTQGENPSHPELLDWLAFTFVESGWDVKQLYRTILLSDTYRQNSKIKERMAERDPENRLLARGPRFRLDAEVIRDQALFASGLLDEGVGGPGVKPYQPGGIWEAVGYTNSNTQTFFQDFGPSAEHRRSIYTFWKRTAHPPNLAIFDAPNREICVMRRERTNTPLQALVLMNDPQFVRASRYLALRVMGESGERDERLDRMALLLRGRPLGEEERRVLINSLDQFQNMYGSNAAAAQALLGDEVNEEFSIEASTPDAAPELAAWTMVANQMLNLDEVLNKN